MPRVALAGNPNSGKTTIFNNLTGLHQHVGNYPGVTVEHKSGRLRGAGQPVEVVDLPGTYSLTAYSIEEIVTRNYIVDEKPAVVVDVVDASNLERNLYLAVQLMELGRPMVIALNMHDVATRRGLKIDVDRLSKLLGMPMVATVGHRNEGTRDLREAIERVLADPALGMPAKVNYGRELNREIAKVRSQA